MNELHNQIETLLKSGQKKEVVVEQVLRLTLEHFHSETGAVHWLDPKRQLLLLAAQLGLPPNMVQAVRTIPVGKGIAGQTVARKQPVTMCNLQTNTSGVAQPGARQTGIGGMVCVPLCDNGTIVGTFGVGTVRPYEYTPEEIKTLEDIGRLVGANLSFKRFANEHAAATDPSNPSSTIPNTVVALVEAAGVAWRRREFQKSLDLLERAHKLAPDEPRILLGLGRHYGIRTDYERAEKYFEKAIRVMGWKTFTFVVAGEHCVFFGRPDLARRYYERALKQNGDTPEALCALAEVEERENHLDTATELISRAEHLNRGFNAATLIKARLYRLTGKKAEAESALRVLVSKPDPNVSVRSKAWYELGKILDDQGRYDEAMTSFLAAKDLMLPNAVLEMQAQQAVQARLEKNGGRYTAGTFQSWLAARDTFQPLHRLALLGGHPRSGTTLLEQVLDTHPDMTSSEETLIFQDEVLSPLTRNLDEDNLPDILNSVASDKIAGLRADYLRLTERHLGRPVGGRLLIDKNPSLTAIIPSVARIFPESKFLIALRDPRDVCLSCFMQSMGLNPITSSWLTLEGTVAEYTSLMGFWLTIKPNMANPWLEVRYEDLVDDLESTARRTLEFLDVPWDASVLGFDKHAQAKVVRSPTYADVKKPVYRGAMGRWRNYQKYLEPYLEKLEPFARAFGYE
jgi:tetratricopeptide (TPR) repeat protein